MIEIECTAEGAHKGIRVQVESEEVDRFCQPIPFQLQTIVGDVEYGLAVYPKTHWRRVTAEAA